MFTCDFCGKPSVPRIKPIMIVLPTDVRDTTYTNMVPDPEGKEDRFGEVKLVLKTTVGTEFVAEYKQCRECAGLPPEAEPKKSAPIPGLESTLGYMLAENTIIRAKESNSNMYGWAGAKPYKPSKRAKADFQAGFQLLKVYEEMGGKI